MKVFIKGGRQRQKDAINEMIFWVGRKLLSRRLYAAIELDITILNLKKEDYQASSCPDNSYRKTAKPRIFKLEFSSYYKLDELREALVHEMVHVKQYAQGHLYDYENDRTRYKGKIYPSSIEDGKRYWQLPYEVEARGLQEGLRMEFREYLKNRGKRY